MSPVLGRFSAVKPIPLLFLVVFSVSAFYWLLWDKSAPRPVLDPAIRVALRTRDTTTVPVR